MKFSQKKFWFILLLINITVFGYNYLLSSRIQKEGLEIARKFDATPTPYVPETEAKEIKPANWYSVYLPSNLPEFYELGSWTQTDNYISCDFSRPIDYKNETSLDNSYPELHYTQWSYKKETISWAKSYLPPILQTGKFQTYGSQSSRFISAPEDQLKLKMNATLQTKTYNDKEYYFCNEAQNGYPFLLWYEGENTLLLAVEPAVGSKSHIEITLDEMLAIADSIENYN